MIRVLGVAGSLRGDSHNRSLLRAAGSLFPPDVQFTEYEALKLIPPFDEDDEPAPGLAVKHWREAVAHTDAILFGTPRVQVLDPRAAQERGRLGVASRDSRRAGDSPSPSSARARVRKGLCGHKPTCARF